MAIVSLAVAHSRRFRPFASRALPSRHASATPSSIPQSPGFIRGCLRSGRTPSISTTAKPDGMTTLVSNSLRSFSAIPPTSSVPGGTTGANADQSIPDSLSPEVALKAQDAMKLYIEHGVGKRKLEEIAAEKEKGETALVDRWQKMIQIYLQAQCHIISLLGYTPDDRGITLYTTHLQYALNLAPPEQSEQLRKSGRDTYRVVLEKAFSLPLTEEQALKGELSIVDARNIMHKVSMRMQEAEVLEKVATLCSVSVAMNNSPEAKQIDMMRKHTVVQEVMVKDVYLGGDPSIAEEHGFGKGEDGYVRFQCAMAEHQGDPLITQYVGTAMLKLLQSAGIDVEAMQALEAMQKK
mmetsp:Transcript_1042/g.1912  ORF Transcript_1042/g.1912 Transcript_1042/m.1912 type:complete len:351 (+) Transcript_1042:3-1055(+)